MFNRKLTKKNRKLQLIKVLIIPLIAMTIVTWAFKVLHDSKFAKSEYDANCNHNYGDAVSLSRCYLPYQFEGNTLDSAFKLEIAAIGISLVVALISYFA